MTDCNVKAKVISSWQAKYPEPLVVKQGQTVSVGKRDTEWSFFWCTNDAGHSGWLPAKCLSNTAGIATCLYDYSTAELTATAGEEVTLSQEDSDWSWATNSSGASGWIPNRCLDISRDIDNSG